MAYPAGIDSFTTKVDGVDTYLAAHVNSLQTSVVNTQTELGTGLKGTAATLAARLAVGLNNDGTVKSAAVTAVSANSVDTAAIQALAVTAAKIANATITATQIALLGVTTAVIADGAVTTAKIGSLQVATSNLADNAVTTVKITDANVTSAKLASGLTLAGTTTVATLVTTAKGSVTAAPTGSANFGLLNVGDQGFAGGGGTNFVGSVSGTAIATNLAAGFAGNQIDLQLAGVSKFMVNASGGLLANNASFVSVVGGASGNAFQWASATATPGTDADYTLTSTEMSKVIVTVVAGSWTSGHNVIVPNAAGGVWHFSNSTGFSMTVKTAAGTGIAIANGRAAWIRSNGTNCRRMTADIDPTV